MSRLTAGEFKGPPESGPFPLRLQSDQAHRERLGGRIALTVGDGHIEDVVSGIPGQEYVRRGRRALVDSRLVPTDGPVEAQRIIPRRAERTRRIQLHVAYARVEDVAREDNGRAGASVDRNGRRAGN